MLKYKQVWMGSGIMKEYLINDGYLYINDPLFQFSDKIKVMSNNKEIGIINKINRKIKIGKDLRLIDIYLCINDEFIYYTSFKSIEEDTCINFNKIKNLLKKRENKIMGVLTNEN